MISKGNRSYGLEVYIKDDGTPEYALCALEKSGEEVVIVESRAGIVSSEVLKQIIKPDYPVTVLVTGKGVLAKNSGDLNNPSFQDLFPGINAGDFYFISANHQGFIARKRVLESIADSLLEMKISLVGVSFGHALIEQNLKLLGDQIQFGEINIRGYTVIVDSGRAPLSTGDIVIGGEKVSLQLLPAYCAALSCFTGTESEFTIDYTPVVSARKNFLLYRKTVKQAMVFAGIMLAIIAVASGLKVYFVTLMSGLNQDNYVLTTGDSRDSIITEIKDKKRFLLEEDWVSASKVSFYADRLAAGVLKGISFNALKVYPANGVNDSEPASFATGKIEIRGKSNSELILKNWTENLKKEAWVASAELSGYEWSSKSNTGDFTLLVNLKE